jgi:hypothetical protein
MLSIDYFKYAVKEELIYNLDWYYTVFTLHDKHFENKYIRIDKHYYVNVNKEYIKIDNVNIDRPLFTTEDTICLKIRKVL